MVSDSQIIDALRRYGYLAVSRADVPKLELSHYVVAEALAKYQDFCFYPLDLLVMRHHGRSLIADGHVGPATRELFSMPRCEIPDFGPDSLPTGSGSWPQPCQKNGVKYHIDWSGAPSSVKATRAQLEADWVELWRLVGLKLVPVSTAAQANIYAHFGAFFGGTIGLASYNSGSCTDRVSLKMSSSYVGENLGLLKHESGHNCNFGHTRGGTMNAYIIKEVDQRGRWLPSDPSWNNCVRFFDGLPVGEPGPGPGPAPPPLPPTPGPSRPILDFIRWLFGW